MNINIHMTGLLCKEKMEGLIECVCVCVCVCVCFIQGGVCKVSEKKITFAAIPHYKNRPRRRDVPKEYSILYTYKLRFILPSYYLLFLECLCCFQFFTRINHIFNRIPCAYASLCVPLVDTLLHRENFIPFRNCSQLHQTDSTVSNL